MNIKLLTLGPQNFYHTSMETPEAKLKTQNPKPKTQKPQTQISNITQNPNSKIQNPKPKMLRVQPLISMDLFKELKPQGMFVIFLHGGLSEVGL